MTYFTHQNGPKGGIHENEFWLFQIQKWILQTVWAEKADEKKSVICQVSMFPSWVTVFKLSKKVHFLQFCADLRKKPKFVKAIYIYGSESSHYSLLQNDMVCRVLSYHPWEISDKNIKREANSAEIYDFKS